MSDKKASLIIDQGDGTTDQMDFPVHGGSLGPDVIDIGALTSHGYFTYDPGFVSTAACESKITFIDGAKGVLLHRGYPIDQLAEHSDYLETCYLLLNGELPSAEEKEKFVNTVTQHTMVHEQIRTFFNGFRRDAHPMAIMCGVVGALSAFYHDSTDISDPHHREVAAFRLIAKMPTIAAMSYKFSIGQPFMYPDNSLDYASNFLHMMFGNPCEPTVISPTLAKAMDRIFLLHADHEQNASTSTVRLAGSSQANPFACIASGIAALWGPSHGGANEAVVKMLEEIGTVDRIEEFVARAKDKSDPFRLMGFGHRVYKNFDPRAKVMKQAADEVLAELGIQDEMLEIAKRLEEIALQDPYFVEKKLYPNVDFYSGIILKAIGIPTSMFTVIFAIGRTVGWIAHWNEMISNPYRIGRPRQLYTGYEQRDFTPVDPPSSTGTTGNTAMTNAGVLITGTGLYTPDATISNEELVESFNAWVDIFNQENAAAIEAGEVEAKTYSSAEFITKASGIKSRYVMDKVGILDPHRMAPHIPERPNESQSVMCEIGCAAARQALENADVAADEIDMLVVAASNMQRAYPAMAVEIQAALGASGYAFDMNVACSSATFGIQQARDAIRAGSARRVLMVNPEICTGHLNFRDRDSHFIFGDVATAVVVEAQATARTEDAYEILDTRLQTIFSNNIRNNFGFLNRADESGIGAVDKLFVQEGRKVFKEVCPAVAEQITTQLADLNIAPEELSRLWLHQANQNMNDLIARKVMGRAPSKDESPTILDEYANTSSAGSIIAFHKFRDDLLTGDLGVLSSFGAGYSIGSVVLRRV